MSYDPCGTQHLEGDEIIRRLAIYLGVDKNDLKAGLLALSAELQLHRTRNERASNEESRA